MSAIGFLTIIADLPNKQPNGFTRHFMLEETLSPEYTIQVEPDAKQIISVTAKNVYLSTDSLGKIYVKDSKLDLTKTLRILLPDSIFEAIGNEFTLQLSPPNVYIFASNLPAVILQNINGKVDRIMPIPGPPFSYAVALSKNSFVLRQFIEGGGDKHFVKYDAFIGSSQPEKNVSLYSGDGGLSTDGQLNYDRIANRLVYMHYYNNTVLRFDTNLVLINRFHTIDTTTNKHRLDGRAPLVSNQKSCIYGNFLLVCSNLKADNEAYKRYRNNIPVDIYEVATGKYKGSFYLPLSRGKLVKSMKTFENNLVVLYHDNRLSLFKLPFVKQPINHR